jgi:hypothetical protein
LSSEVVRFDSVSANTVSLAVVVGGSGGGFGIWVIECPTTLGSKELLLDFDGPSTFA